MRQLLPLATSVITVAAMYVVGKHKWWGWLLGLCNQILWVWFIIVFAAYGLVPLTVVLSVVYTRNLWSWRRAAQLTASGTVVPAVMGGRFSGAPRDLPRESQEAKTRANLHDLYDWSTDPTVVAFLGGR